MEYYMRKSNDLPAYSNVSGLLCNLVGFFLLVLYIVAVAVMPRIQGHLRFEDFLTPLMFLMIFAFLRKSVLQYVFLPALYFYYSFLVTAVNIIIDRIPLIALLVWGKELQYFFGFALICGIILHKRDYIVRLFSIIRLLVLFGVISGAYSLILGKQSYYGLGYFNEPRSPSLSMLMYFNLGVLSLFYANIIGKGKRIFFISGMVSFCLALLVGSRTGVVIVLVFVGAWLFFCSRYKVTFLFLISLMIVLSVASLVMFNYNISDLHLAMYHNHVNNKPISAAISRASAILILPSAVQASRFSSWKSILELGFNNDIIFGNGRGFTHVGSYGFGLGLGADNQYTVNLAEVGILGSALFFLMLYGFSKKIHYKLRSFYFSYLLAYLLAGMTMEVWQLSKGGQMFWIVTALFLMCSRNLNYLSENNFCS